MKNEPAEKKPSEIKEEKLPKTRAFQIPFTRGFIASTDEVENGYYTLKSKTGSYTMLFPEGGSISEESYFNEESKAESFLTGIKNKGLPNASLSVSYIAETSNTAKGLKYSLKFLKSQADMNEPFHQKKPTIQLFIGQFLQSTKTHMRTAPTTTHLQEKAVLK